MVYFSIIMVVYFSIIIYNLISETFDAAMLKAFLVFIAFTNMRSKSREAEMDAKQLLKKTMGLFEHDKY